MLSLMQSIMVGIVTGVHDAHHAMTGADVNAATQAVIAASKEAVSYIHKANFVSSQLSKMVKAGYVTCDVVDDHNEYMPSKAGIDLLRKSPEAVARITQPAPVQAQPAPATAKAVEAASTDDIEAFYSGSTSTAPVKTAKAAVKPAKLTVEQSIEIAKLERIAALQAELTRLTGTLPAPATAKAVAPVKLTGAKAPASQLKVKLDVEAYTKYTLTKKGIVVDNVPANIDDCIVKVLQVKDLQSSSQICDAIIANLEVLLPRAAFKSVINSVMHKTAYAVLWTKTGTIDAPVWKLNPAYK